jgi:hypothetical protein
MVLVEIRYINLNISSGFLLEPLKMTGSILESLLVLRYQQQVTKSGSKTNIDHTLCEKNTGETCPYEKWRRVNHMSPSSHLTLPSNLKCTLRCISD